MRWMNWTPVLTAAVLVSVAPAASHAQTGFGLKGGLSFGNVSNRGILPGDLDTRTGFAVGLFVGSKTGLLGLGAEALYAQRGLESSTLGASRELDYLDVPGYVRLMIPTPLVAPFAYAGPQISFELRCRAGGVSCPDTDRARTNVAAVIGAGARLGAVGALSIEGRYIYGLSDLSLNTVTSPESYETRSFLILAGIGF